MEKQPPGKGVGWTTSILIVALLATAASLTYLGLHKSQAHNNVGTVVGGIVPCYGSASPPSPPTYWAGTVTVLRGALGAGSGNTGQLPTEVVAQEQVAMNEAYRFRLPAGTYVLKATVTGSNLFVPPTQVSLEAGQTLRVDFPTECL